MHNFKHLSHRTKTVLLAILLVLLLLSITRIIFDIRRGPPRDLFDKSFAGVVTQVQDNQFSVRDRFGNLKVFAVASTTKIFSGNEILLNSQLQTDQFVMVQSDMDLKNPSDIYTTKSVRVLENR